MTCREKIMSEAFEEILVDYDIQKADSQFGGNGYCYQPVDKEFGILYSGAAYTAPLNTSQYRYTYIPKCYGLLRAGEGDISYEQTGTLRAQRSPLALTGKQVLIGFIDTGIRSGLPAFLREDGGSRILSVWDQQDMEGSAPVGFLYGSEYIGDTPYRARLIARGQGLGDETAPGNRSRLLEDFPQSDPDGHGTAVASIAAGCAPDALLLMVRCRQAKQYLRRYYAIPEEADAFAESDLITGLAYLKNVSDFLGLPLVICVTMGTNMGSHAAHSLLDRYLTYLGNRRGTAIVVAGGNEGNQAHHYTAVIEPGEKEYRDIEVNVSDDNSGFFMELWGSLPAIYTVSVRSPDGEEIYRVPIRYGQTQEFSFIYSQSKLNIDYILVERASAQQLISVRINAPLPGIWTIRVYMDNTDSAGQIHAWLPITAFLDHAVYFLEPDPYETMTEPAYLDEAISLTYYDAGTGSFAIDSGRGYREESRLLFAGQVPDLAAPGIDIDTAVGRRSGASMAAALTAGCAAQFMEWAVTRGQDPLVSSKGVRNYFIRGCKRDHTERFPSPAWGYGKLSLTGVFDVLKQ